MRQDICELTACLEVNACSMKLLPLLIVTLLPSILFAETAAEYHNRKAFEAGYDSEDRQLNAIRECAVSRIQTCIYPIIEHLKNNQDETLRAQKMPTSLVEYAKKDNPRSILLRRESANALGRLRAPEGRDALLALLPKEQDISVKAAIVRALGLIGNKNDIKTISPYLNDTDAMLRRIAARALYNMNDKAASAEVSGKVAGEKDDLTRAEMLNTVLQHEGGKVENAIALAKILFSPDRAARMRTAEVLATYKNKETLGDLERALRLETDLPVRSAIAAAIQATSFAN